MDLEPQESPQSSLSDFFALVVVFAMVCVGAWLFSLKRAHVQVSHPAPEAHQQEISVSAQMTVTSHQENPALSQTEATTSFPGTKEFLPGGIGVQIQRSGNKIYPKAFDRIHLHYRGKFEDGREFDSSYRRNTPFAFVLGINQVIPGLDTGLRRVDVGARAILNIPAELAYGAKGVPPVIPPNANLQFEVEVLSTEPSGVPSSIPDTAGLTKTTTGTAEASVEIFTLAEGSGEPVGLGSKATVHYVGWLENGRMFDSSLGRGEPFSFVTGSGVIEGWSLVVAGMKPNQKVLAKIPPALGYGSRKMDRIPPGSTLIFQIEVLKVERP